MIDYLTHGETWENDPQAYQRSCQGKRAEFEAALNDTDILAMVASWADQTLYNVELAGSDLAFTAHQNTAIRRAAVAERARRWFAAGGRIPDENGMG
jgi:hypothetical protein